MIYTTVLYIWMVVAAAPGPRVYYGWVNSGEYTSIEVCKTAAAQLGFSNEQYRCISKVTGLQK